MITLPLTGYDDAGSEAIVNEYQDSLDALAYPATAVRYQWPVYVTFVLPDDLVAAFNAANATKKQVMIGLAVDVMNDKTVTDFNTAYHALYDPLYP